MRETRARKREGVKWYEAKPAMDVDDFRRLLARKAQADVENEALQRAEEAEAAAEEAAQAEHAARPAIEHELANGAAPMDTGEDDAAAEDSAVAAGRSSAAALAASAALKQQEAEALESAERALRVRDVPSYPVFPARAIPIASITSLCRSSYDMTALQDASPDCNQSALDRVVMLLETCQPVATAVLKTSAQESFASAGEAGGEAAAARGQGAAAAAQGAGASAAAAAEDNGASATARALPMRPGSFCIQVSGSPRSQTIGSSDASQVFNRHPRERSACSVTLRLHVLGARDRFIATVNTEVAPSTNKRVGGSRRRRKRSGWRGWWKPRRSRRRCPRRLRSAPRRLPRLRRSLRS